MKQAVVAVLCALVLAAAAGSARGEDEKSRQQRARAFAEEGKAKYDLGKFDEAIDLFTKAYDIWPYPELLFGLCQSHRQQQNFTRAIFYCKGYLRQLPDAANRNLVEGLILDMEDTVKKQKATEERPPQGVELPGSGGTGTARSASDAPGRRAWYRDPLGWGLVGGGVAAMLVGGGFVLSSSSLTDDAGAAANEGGSVRISDDSSNRETIGWVAGVVGACVFTAGVVQLAIPDKAGTEDGATKVSIGAGWIGVSGRF